MSGSFGKSQSSSNQRVWDAQAPYLRDLYSRAGDLIQAQPATNPLQTQGQNMALGYAGRVGGDIYDPSRSALNFAFNAPNVNQNPYAQQAVRGAINPMISAFKEEILPSIGRSAEMAGQFGGSRQGIAEGIATGKLMDSIGDISSRMMSDAYTSGLQAQSQALGMAPSIASLGLLPSTIYQDVGAQQLMAPWQQLQAYGGILGGPQVLGSSNSWSVNMSGKR